MSIQEHASTRSFYDRISHAYDLIADAGEHKVRERGLEILAAQEGEDVLEIGYGTGHSLTELAEKVGSSGRVSGVDISQGMYDIASRRVAEAGFASRVELAVAAVPPLSYEDESFDAVSMSFVMELFPLEQIAVLLAEIARVLRPGGRVSIVSMATTTDSENDSVLEYTYKWLHQHFPHIVDCQPIDVVKFVRDAGFVNVQESRMEIWSLPVAIVLGKRSK
jgi:demethylmenaquinone methyltransferase/2-methoxy-6-polyprenyl-1,4-benzoquinol methylase